MYSRVPGECSTSTLYDIVFVVLFRFTQNLSLFRRDVNDSLKATGNNSPSTSQNSLDMMNL